MYAHMSGLSLPICPCTVNHSKMVTLGQGLSAAFH